MALIDLKETVDFWKNAFGFKPKPAPPVASPANTSYVIPDFITPAPQFTPIISKPKVEEVTEPAGEEFNPGDFISSKEFTDTSALSENQIQEFLKSKNSFLKDYSINGHLISYWIYKNSSDNGLNPKIILTHAQKEQGLISQSTLPKKQRRIDYALGVGATDGGDNPKWKGMDQQFLGGTLTCMRWYNKGEKQNKYPMVFPASDNPHLIISNSAVFSLYKFTPWVGNQDKLIDKNLYKSPFGNYLFFKIYQKWFK